MSKIINVGRVTSYADAVAGGYQGTREEWEIVLANLGTTAAEVEANRQAVNEILGVDNDIITTLSFTAGKMVYYNNGVLSSNSNYSYTNYIDISGYTTIIYPRLYTKGTSGNPGIAFYSDDNSYISGVSAVKGYSENTYEYVQLTVPTNAKYIRLTMSTVITDTLYLKDPDITKSTLKDQVYKNQTDINNLTPIPQNYINVYNPNDNDITPNSEIDRSGTITASANFNVSGYIPCESGKKYTFPLYTNHSGTGDAARSIPLYDSNKSYLTYKTGTLSGSILTITIPANAKYFRVNICSANANNNNIQTAFHSNGNFMVTEGNVFPDRFYPYDVQSYASANIYSGHTNLTNPLYTKSAVFLGDSICQGDDLSGWAGRIGRNNTMLWSNGGVNGSTISTAQSGKVICTRTIKISNPDYIIFEGGTNDADMIGSVIGGSVPAGFGSFSDDDYGTNDAATYFGFDIDTYCGAFEYLCKRLITNYPGAKIGYIVAHKMGAGASGYTPTNNNRRAYFKTAMEICHKWGIPYLNLWDGCYLNPKIPALYTSGSADSLYSDGQHLQAKGYEYISPIIETWMKTL